MDELLQQVQGVRGEDSAHIRQKEQDVEELPSCVGAELREGEDSQPPSSKLHVRKQEGPLLHDVSVLQSPERINILTYSPHLPHSKRIRRQRVPEFSQSLLRESKIEQKNLIPRFQGKKN